MASFRNVANISNYYGKVIIYFLFNLLLLSMFVAIARWAFVAFRLSHHAVKPDTHQCDYCHKYCNCDNLLYHLMLCGNFTLQNYDVFMPCEIPIYGVF